MLDLEKEVHTILQDTNGEFNMHEYFKMIEHEREKTHEEGGLLLITFR